jgi:predicted  nucleic acid-binding Zn-ribbon protein
LHISLGVYKKLYDLFERDCHEVDLELFHLRVQAQDNFNLTNFDDQVRDEKERLGRIQEQLHEKRVALESAEEDLPLYVLQNEMEEIDDNFRDAATLAFKLRSDIQALEKEAETSQLSYATGPVASSLDEVLHKFKVQRQAYHGKAFVGNHVHKCCEVIRKI